MDFSNIVVPDTGDATEDGDTAVTTGMDANTILLTSKPESPILDEVHRSSPRLKWTLSQ